MRRVSNQRSCRGARLLPGHQWIPVADHRYMSVFFQLDRNWWFQLDRHVLHNVNHLSHLSPLLMSSRRTFRIAAHDVVLQARDMVGR